MPSFLRRQSNTPSNHDFSTKRTGEVVPVRDWRAGYIPVSEVQLHKTGLRGGKLTAVVVCLVLLWIFAIITFTCNILLLVYLGVGPRGLDYVQLMTLKGENGQTESLVQFPHHEVDLGRILTSSGIVGGYLDQSLDLSSSKIESIVRHKREGRETKLTMEDGKIWAENVNDFRISSTSRSSLFSATIPRIPEFKPGIRTLAVRNIITNMIRSPWDKKLMLNATGSEKKVTLGGNENSYLTSENLKITSGRNINITSKSEDHWLQILDAKLTKMLRQPVAERLQAARIPID